MEFEQVSPEQNTEQVSNTEQTEQPDQANQSNVLDLDSVEKFRWSGRELTPKDLQSMVLMQSDYTRKTQSLAEEKKYMDALQYDLPKLKLNPALAEEFKKVYPEKYHYILDHLSPQQAQTKEAQTQSIPPQLLNDIEMFKKDLEERKLQAAEKEIDAVFDKYKSKYPLALDDVVCNYAQAMIDKGQKLNDQVWENIFKTVHSQMETKYKDYYAQNVNKQKSANEKGKDVGSGGGIPGQAPVMPRNIKEAGIAFRQAHGIED